MGTLSKRLYIVLNLALVAGFMALALTSTQAKASDDPQTPTTTDDGSDDTDFLRAHRFLKFNFKPAAKLQGS